MTLALSTGHADLLEHATGGDVLRIPPKGGGEADPWHLLPERVQRRLVSNGFAVPATTRVVGLNGKVRHEATTRGRLIDEYCDTIMANIPGLDSPDAVIDWWVRQCDLVIAERRHNGRARGLAAASGETVVSGGLTAIADAEMDARPDDEWADACAEFEAAWADDDATTGEASVGPRTFAYLRVSTDQQADAGTILNQVDAIETWCTENDVELTDLWQDEGISGSEGIEVRIGLAQALDTLREGDTLIVYRLDRLARDLLLQETLLRTIWRKGARIVSCSPAEAEYLTGDDPSDPSRRLVRQIMGAVAEYERGMIRARTLAGRRRKRSMGGFVGGPVPFGFMVAGGLLLEHPDEMPLLREMTRRNDRGDSFQTIAAWMTGKTGETWLRMRCYRVITRYRAEMKRAGLEP